jgi:hypothetical protein
VSTPQRNLEERRSRIERSRPLGGIGFLLIVLGVVCLFAVGPKTGIALIVLGALVCTFWVCFPYARTMELTASRFRADMSDPKGGVEEITIPLDPEPEPPPHAGRFRRLRHWRPRSRGSGRG